MDDVEQWSRVGGFGGEFYYLGVARALINAFTSVSLLRRPRSLDTIHAVETGSIETGLTSSGTDPLLISLPRGEQYIIKYKILKFTDINSKPRKSGSALPNVSNQAMVGVSAPSPLPQSRRQSQQGGHPFASNKVLPGERNETYDASNIAVQSQAGLQPISPMNVNSRGGNTAANSQQLGEGDYHQENKGNGFIRFITCGCFR